MPQLFSLEGRILCAALVAFPTVIRPEMVPAAGVPASVESLADGTAGQLLCTCARGLILLTTIQLYSHSRSIK